MESTRSVIQVTGARETSAPATWAQRAIWLWHGVADDSEARTFNLRDAFRFPDGCTIAAVLAAVERVVRRYDALRSVYRRDGDGWRQVVQGDGEVTVELCHTTGPEAGAVRKAVFDRLATEPWSVRRWPLRLAVVVADGSPAHLVLAANRLTLDGQSLAIVGERIVAASTGDSGDAEPPWQPADQAAFERSRDGQAVTDRALAHWRQALLAGPPSMFDVPVHEPDGGMLFRRLLMSSPALAYATRMLRRRWGVSHSALLLAAATTVLGRYTGHPSVVMQMMTGNRLDRQRRELVGTLAAEGAYHLDLTGLTFVQVARRAFQASGRAHRFGLCDPDQIGALRAELGRRRGAYLDVAAVYNDVQTALGEEVADEPDLSGAELRELAGRTAIAEDAMPRSPAQVDVRLHLTAKNSQGMPLMLYCDTRYVPAAPARGLLLGMERLLVAAAAGEADAGDPGEVSGVEPVRRGPSWARCGDGWVDVAAAQRLWRQVAGYAPAAVAAEATPAGDRELVGYLAGDTAPDFAKLHAGLVTELGTRTDVRAPDRYRWIAEPPADPDDPAAWREAAVLAEGDGR